MYLVPEEHDFVYEGFGLTKKHRPNDGVYSYVYLYEEGKELHFTHSIWGENHISLQLINNDECEVDIFLEREISHIEFLGWGNDKLIRIRFRKGREEVKVIYFPKPKIKYEEV